MVKKNVNFVIKILSFHFLIKISSIATTNAKIINTSAIQMSINKFVKIAKISLINVNDVNEMISNLSNLNAKPAKSIMLLMNLQN